MHLPVSISLPSCNLSAAAAAVDVLAVHRIAQWFCSTAYTLLHMCPPTFAQYITDAKSEQLSFHCAGRGHSCSPLKRLKASDDVEAPKAGDTAASPGAHVDSDDAELARKLHEQLNGPDSPTAALITRHITRVRKAPTFYKPEVLLVS